MPAVDLRNDDALNRLMLIHVIDLIGQGQLDQFVEAGIAPTSLQRLVHMPACEIGRFASQARKALTAAVDLQEFGAALSRHEAMMDEEQMFDYFVLHCATIDMLTRMFKVEKRRIEHARQTLANKSKGGRPKMPPESVREAMKNKWVELPRSTPERNRFFALHQMFSAYTLGQMYSTIIELRKDKK
jgi:hypothetical protein